MPHLDPPCHAEPEPRSTTCPPPPSASILFLPRVDVSTIRAHSCAVKGPQTIQMTKVEHHVFYPLKTDPNKPWSMWWRIAVCRVNGKCNFPAPSLANLASPKGLPHPDQATLNSLKSVMWRESRD